MESPAFTLRDRARLVAQSQVRKGRGEFRAILCIAAPSCRTSRAPVH